MYSSHVRLGIARKKCDTEFELESIYDATIVYVMRGVFLSKAPHALRKLSTASEAIQVCSRHSLLCRIQTGLCPSLHRPFRLDEVSFDNLESLLRTLLDRSARVCL